MSIKTVLALADSSITVESTLTSAVAVARRFGAHLEALHVRPDPADFVPVMAGRIPAQMVEQLMANKQAESAENRNKARAAYESICLSSGLSTGWQEATGWEPETLARAGRFADLLAVAKRDGEMSETIEAALFDSGRPILVLTGKAMPSIGDRIVAGWNGSTEAARAVTAAIPFFRLAEQVHLVMIEDEVREAPNALVPYLARHGVKATVHVVQPGNRSAGNALLDAASRFGADLLVMGAYGRSRVREWIWGGATREVLAGAALPVLMMH